VIICYLFPSYKKIIKISFKQYSHDTDVILILQVIDGNKLLTPETPEE